jgi:hypothetical protein
MRVISFLLLGWLLLSAEAQAQNQRKQADLIQLSGVVATNDTIQPIPYCNLFITNRGFGTLTDFDGFFSIVVNRGDSILFSHQGFQSDYFVVPDTLEKHHYSMVMLLVSDTVLLPTTEVFPWPSKEQFKEYFLAMEVPMDDLDRAQRNLAIETMREQAMAMGYDAKEIGDFVIDNYNNQYYNAGRYYGANGGQAILSSLTNPFAWAEFFKAIKRGDFNKND